MPQVARTLLLLKEGSSSRVFTRTDELRAFAALERVPYKHAACYNGVVFSFFLQILSSFGGHRYFAIWFSFLP